MALICNRHSFEYAENVCSRCGLPFCHDCLVYPRGPKKPPLCVNCAIAAAGVRSSARTQSNLSRREVKRRVREAKGMQQAQAHDETPAPVASDERDVELTSRATFDQGWAVSGDDGRDPLPGYPEPVHVNWGNDPAQPATVERHESPHAPVRAPDTAMPIPPTRPAFVATADPGVAPAAVFVADDTPPSRAELPRLQQVELPRPHAPVRPGGLPSVRPPLKQPGTDLPRTKLPAPAPQGPKLARPAAAADPNAPDRPNPPDHPNPPMPSQQPRVYGGAPATRPEAPATRPEAQAPTPASGRLRRKEPESEESAMLGWLDDLLGTQKEEGPRS